jgi:hypothetical protein
LSYPYEALGQAVPAKRYQSSPRLLPPFEYPGHAEIRRINPNGYVS